MFAKCEDIGKNALCKKFHFPTFRAMRTLPRHAALMSPDLNSAIRETETSLACCHRGLQTYMETRKKYESKKEFHNDTKLTSMDDYFLYGPLVLTKILINAPLIALCTLERIVETDPFLLYRTADLIGMERPHFANAGKLSQFDALTCRVEEEPSQHSDLQEELFLYMFARVALRRATPLVDQSIESVAMSGFARETRRRFASDYFYRTVNVARPAADGADSWRMMSREELRDKQSFFESFASNHERYMRNVTMKACVGQYKEFLPEEMRKKLWPGSPFVRAMMEMLMEAKRGKTYSCEDSFTRIPPDLQPFEYDIEIMKLFMLNWPSRYSKEDYQQEDDLKEMVGAKRPAEEALQKHGLLPAKKTGTWWNGGAEEPVVKRRATGAAAKIKNNDRAGTLPITAASWNKKT